MSQLVSAVRAAGEAERSRRGISHATFAGVCVLGFAASAAATIAGNAAMAAMGEMPMPGGWTLSTTWTRMCGQTWAGIAASFIGMWIVMMPAMMLPSVAPRLWRYREAVGRSGATCPGWLTLLVSVGYFVVWALLGVVIFALGVALAALVVRLPPLARAVPMAAGVAVVIAGALQFTAWKARRLVCCREAPGHCGDLPGNAGDAVRYGLRLGLHCVGCCANLTAILLVVGVMDLRAMAVVTMAISGERLVPGGERVARAIGAALVGGGLMLIVQAIAFG